MSNTFNVRFILKTDKVNKKGSAPIFARIIFNRKKIEIITNRSINLESWIAENDCALPVNKSNKDLNKYLESYKGKIFLAYSTLLPTGEIINADNFKEAFFGKPAAKKYYLIETTKEHNDQFEKLIGTKFSYGKNDHLNLYLRNWFCWRSWMFLLIIFI